jgi:hypothetical protein
LSSLLGGGGGAGVISRSRPNGEHTQCLENERGKRPRRRTDNLGIHPHRAPIVSNSTTTTTTTTIIHPPSQPATQPVTGHRGWTEMACLPWARARSPAHAAVVPRGGRPHVQVSLTRRRRRRRRDAPGGGGSEFREFCARDAERCPATPSRTATTGRAAAALFGNQRVVLGGAPRKFALDPRPTGLGITHTATHGLPLAAPRAYFFSFAETKRAREREGAPNHVRRACVCVCGCVCVCVCVTGSRGPPMMRG